MFPIPFVFVFPMLQSQMDALRSSGRYLKRSIHAYQAPAQVPNVLKMKVKAGSYTDTVPMHMGRGLQY